MNLENYAIISQRFRFSEILINLLLYSDLEIGQMILRIFYFICTILNINSMNKMYEEFRSLSILIKECTNDVSFQIIMTLYELLIFDFNVFQPIYIETDVYLSLQMNFLYLLNIDSHELELRNPEALRKKDQKLNFLMKILKLLLKNNNKLISSFLDIGHFEILLNNLDLHKKILNPFILFFLEEEAKNVNLQPYLDFLMKKIKNIHLISEYKGFFNMCSILTRSLTNSESKKVFREALLKRFDFFSKFLDSICFLKTFHPVFEWGLEKQKILIKSLIFLKKYITKSSFLRGYCKKKNFFYELIERISNLFPFLQLKVEEILLIILDFAIVPCSMLPLNKKSNDHKKALKQKELLLKSWDYFKNDGFFVLFPELIKYTIELFLKKCNNKIQMNFFEVVVDLCQCSINRNLFNKIAVIDSLRIIYPEIFRDFNKITEFYLKIYFLICQDNFNRKLALNLGFILDNLLTQVRNL